MPRYKITVAYKTRAGKPKQEELELWAETGDEATTKVLRRVKHNCLASHIEATCEQVR